MHGLLAGAESSNTICSEYRAFRVPCSMDKKRACVQIGEASSLLRNSTYLLALAHALGYPCLNLRPGLVDRKEASFTAALDQLVGLHDQRRAREPRVVLLDFGEASFGTPLEHFSLNLSEDKGHSTDSIELVVVANRQFRATPSTQRHPRTHAARNRTNDVIRSPVHVGRVHICLFVTNLNTAVLDVVVAILRDPFGHEALAMVLPDSLSRHFERSNRKREQQCGAYACFERGRDPRWVYIPPSVSELP